MTLYTPPTLWLCWDFWLFPNTSESLSCENVDIHAMLTYIIQRCNIGVCGRKYRLRRILIKVAVSDSRIGSGQLSDFDDEMLKMSTQEYDIIQRDQQS